MPHSNESYLGEPARQSQCWPRLRLSQQTSRGDSVSLKSRDMWRGGVNGLTNLALSCVLGVMSVSRECQPQRRHKERRAYHVTRGTDLVIVHVVGFPFLDCHEWEWGEREKENGAGIRVFIPGSRLHLADCRPSTYSGYLKTSNLAN